MLGSTASPTGFFVVVDIHGLGGPLSVNDAPTRPDSRSEHVMVNQRSYPTQSGNQQGYELVKRYPALMTITIGLLKGRMSFMNIVVEKKLFIASAKRAHSLIH